MAVLVYASVIPQFLTASNSPSDAFVLGVIFALLGFLSLLVYALVFSAAGAFLSNGRLMRNLLRGSGGILVFCGAVCSSTARPTDLRTLATDLSPTGAGR